ncbi:MAG: SpoIID/LytB domain-containing protein [Planctomycetota bacterium]
MALLTAVIALSVGLTGCSPRRTATVAPEPVWFGTEPDIRVLVATTDGPIRLATTDKTPLTTRDADNGSRTGQAPSGASFAATRAGSAFGVSTPGLTAARVEVESQAGLIYDSKRLGPRAEIAVESADGEPTLRLIAIVPLEQYVAGVAAAELYASWEREAYEAQCVAARTYALHERARARASGRSYDVLSSTLDQVFEGLTRNETAQIAARATRGSVLLDEDKQILRAYYSSTCGGRPSSAAGIWPSTGSFAFNAALPLQGLPRACPCEASSRYRWERERSVADVTARLKAWGREKAVPIRRMADLVSIEPVEFNDARRPNAYRVTDSDRKTYLISAEELRTALNTPARGRPSITGKTRVPSGDLSAVVEGSTVTLVGRGFGHGVGLCQFGAQSFAKQGEEAADMLELFYPGAERAIVYD